MLIFHSDTHILMALLGEEESSAGDHIKNGYPELLEEWEAGRIRATKLKGSPSRNDLIIDAGKPRPMTEEEIKTRDAALAAEASEKAAATDLEAKIQAELRAIAIERIEAKEQLTTKV